MYVSKVLTVGPKGYYVPVIRAAGEPNPAAVAAIPCTSTGAQVRERKLIFIMAGANTG